MSTYDSLQLTANAFLIKTRSGSVLLKRDGEYFWPFHEWPLHTQFVMERMREKHGRDHSKWHPFARQFLGLSQ